MANQYRDDKDLELLRYAEQDMLSILVKYLTEDKDGSKRLTERLTTNEDFQQSEGNYKKVWQLIAAELQHFGGDTFVNLVRGQGVNYREILIDVCNKLDVEFNKNSKTVEIEKAMLAKLIADSWENMTKEQQEELMSQLNIDATLSAAAALHAILTSIRMGGFMSYKVAVIVANSVAKALLGRGLTIAGNAALTRTLGLLTGPIGWAITALITVPAISGPAFRVTLPCVIQIAAMRQMMLKEEEAIF